MILQIIILLLAIPVGILVANVTKDEWKPGKKWFLILTVISLILSVFFALNRMEVESYTCFFIFIVSEISYYYSKKKI